MRSEHFLLLQELEEDEEDDELLRGALTTFKSTSKSSLSTDLFLPLVSFSLFLELFGLTTKYN